LKDLTIREPESALQPTLFPSRMDRQEVANQAAHCNSWTSWEDCFWFHKYASFAPEGSYILEIGTYLGRSAYAMGIQSQAARLVLVDPWGNGNQMACPTDDLWRDVQNNLRRFRIRGAKPRVYYVRGGSENPAVIRRVSNAIRGLPYGFIFIDGLHTYTACKADIQHYVLPNVPLDAFVGMHDYMQSAPGSTQAINELLDGGEFRLVETTGNLAILKRVAL